MQDLLGLPASSETLWTYVHALGNGSGNITKSLPRVYPDCVYYNYPQLGLSLLFKPTEGYKLDPKAAAADLDLTRLKLDGIDMFNAIGESENDASRTADKLYKPFTHLPLTLQLSSTNETSSTSEPFSLVAGTTGKDLVSALGEPARKGGGGGPSGGGIAIWCDWPVHGIMIEFGGPDSKGPKAWEAGKDARWAILSVYTPNKQGKA
ncbi:hypothetical protein DL93DRAFT_2076678 [Clavulina sp. PMI_390]|nr:hypothetical protein DL93DRAFT_2076678 [Clavulina sp. PMI_390]